MKKLNHIALWSLLVLYLVLALSFVGRKKADTICSKLKVTVLDSLDDQFVNSKDIQNYLYDLDQKVLGEQVANINIRKIEHYLEGKPAIQTAEMYFTAEGNLHVDVDQRNPIVRIINDKGRSYYLDRHGIIIPIHGNQASHVLVATGEIKEFFEIARTRQLNCPAKHDTKRNYTICQIYDMARFINDHPFWKSQIEQVYVNNKGEYELIPRVGGHLIKLGSHSGYQKKLRNLKAFYLKGLNNVGWNQYLEINLKYDNQIICTKR